MPTVPKLVEVITDENGVGVDVLFDGESLPFYLGEDITVDLTDRGRSASITISIPAERVIIREAGV